VTGQPRGARAPARELRNGVLVIRTRGTTLRPDRFAARVLNYVSYFTTALITALRLPPQDVVVAMTDPPIVGVAALAARRKKTAFVFLCQDIFPEVAVLLDDFRSSLVNRWLDRINRYVIRQSDRIVALGECMARRLQEEKGADPARVAVIHNWADVHAIVPSARRNAFSARHALDDHFVVLHAGNIGQGQNLTAAIEAAEHLRETSAIRLLFIGDGTRRRWLEDEIASRRLTNVQTMPFQPRHDLRWTYATADICLISLEPGLSGYIVPSKVYPILAAGRPYVAAVDADSEVAAIARQFDCGIVVQPTDSLALAHAIRALANDPHRRVAMGARAREAALQFAREKQVAAHAALYRAVAFAE